MSSAAKLCNVVFWLALCFWLAAPITAGIAAMTTFGTLPDMPMQLGDYAAYPAEEHGLLAAGQVMEKNFFVVDMIQFASVPLVIITLLLQLFVFKMPLRRPSNVIRAGCLIVAGSLFALYAFTLAPRMNRSLRDYWQAASAGEVEQARTFQQSFQTDHPRAESILKINLFLLVIAVGASAIAMTTAPGSRSSDPSKSQEGSLLETPELLKTP